MKTAIEIILALVAMYSAFSWLTWASHGFQTQRRGCLPDMMTIQSCIGSGISMILALGFLGLML